MLGNNKIFFVNEELTVDLGSDVVSINTTPASQKVFCQIVDTTNTDKIILAFDVCDATNLAAIKIGASGDTNINEFY